MEKEKNQKANLEKTRIIFLAIGLIATFTLMSFAFNWQSEKMTQITEEESETTEPIEIIPITKPEPPKPNVEKNIPEKIIKDEFFMVENDKPVDTAINIVVEPDDKPVFIVIPESKDTTYFFVKQMPQFHGGELALRRFVAANVEYPGVARENGIQGTIHLRFQVTKTGSVGSIEILNKNADVLLQNAAYEVIRKLPDFEPGIQNGEYVNVWYSMPISFKLN
jgi:protein TonB